MRLRRNAEERRRISPPIFQQIVNNALVDLRDDGITTTGGLVTGWTNSGYGGSAYSLATVVGTGANLKPHPTGSLLLFGASGDYASTPDTAGNSPTGDVTLEFYGAADDWAPASGQMLVCKSTSAPNFSYFLRLESDGTVTFDLSADGTNRTAASSDALGFTNGEVGGIRGKWDQSASQVVFETSTDGVNWVAQSTKTLTLSGIADTGTSIAVGATPSGDQPFIGTVKWAKVYKDATATTATCSMLASDYASGTTFSSGGVTWTLNGNAFIQNTGHTVVHSIGSAGLETSAGTDIVNPRTVMVIARFSDALPSANQGMLDARSSSTTRMILQSNHSNSDKFTAGGGAGVIITLTQAYDNASHLFTLQSNGDTTSKLTVSGVGNVSGSVGNTVWDYGTIFTNYDGTLSMPGYIARLLVWNYALSANEIAAMQNYLSVNYGLG